MNGEIGEIYGLEFSGRLGGDGHKGAARYIGWCRTGEVHRRLDEHRKGWGAKITAAAAAAGFEITLVWVIAGTRDDERRIKKSGHYDRAWRKYADRQQEAVA